MRVKKGTLKKIAKKTGISVQQLSDLVATRRRPSPKRALLLEEATAGKVAAVVWLYGGPSEIKNALAILTVKP